MAQTVGVLQHEVDKSKTYLDRVSQQDQRIAEGALDFEQNMR